MPFKKGHKKTGGRKKGSTTVTIAQLRDVCLQAIEELGDDDKGRNGALGYIKKFAREERKTFMGSIVARLIPQQIRADIVHAYDPDTAIAAIEHSLTGLIAARRFEGALKDVTPDPKKLTEGGNGSGADEAGVIEEDVAILVSTSTKTA